MPKMILQFSNSEHLSKEMLHSAGLIFAIRGCCDHHDNLNAVLRFLKKACESKITNIGEHIYLMCGEHLIRWKYRAADHKSRNQFFFNRADLQKVIEVVVMVEGKTKRQNQAIADRMANFFGIQVAPKRLDIYGLFLEVASSPNAFQMTIFPLQDTWFAWYYQLSGAAKENTTTQNIGVFSHSVHIDLRKVRFVANCRNESSEDEMNLYFSNGEVDPNIEMHKFELSQTKSHNGFGIKILSRNQLASSFHMQAQDCAALVDKGGEWKKRSLSD